MRGLCRTSLLATLLAMTPFVASAQTQSAPSATGAWPTQQIRLIVPYSAGGTTDFLGRLAADYISKRTGQNVIVENRTGAGGNIGADIVAKSAPDGLTLAMITDGVMTTNPYLYRSMPFDSAKDLVVAAIVGEAPQVIVVNKDVPAKTLQEFVALSKARPGSINYASAGIGSSNQLSALQLERIAGIKMVHVPYRGAAPAVADLASGQVQMISVGVAPVISLVQAGQLRLLAATTKKRMPLLPDLPTAAESGAPGYESTTWFGIVAPSATPAPIIERINGLMRDLVADPDTKKRFDDNYLIAWNLTPPEISKLVADQAAMWEKIIKEAGIKLD
ncbi:tripartite tricarboxylate transporter substrate binding protein [Roseiarcaceae bacterium H3SJ34-1]|uniref:Bug family tripartite tricarboxylate transporter substrate binding protein n=1 Tax=Terripilifer ovatus TaxID=3032367 RepID=UPI003AB96AA2|nr:tripartite tricarboxylate transporter substrate binding protein [Roseiarcaceae bacterium H3SJ34-1]